MPVAANRPYWFEPDDGGSIVCPATTEMWTMFGINDTHFTWQDRPGQFGDECRDFWLDQRGCTGEATFTPIEGTDGECVEYDGCTSRTRYCLYGAQTNHEIPAYFPQLVLDYFRSF